MFKKIKISVTNMYLIKCNDGYLLIDTTYSSKYKNFLKKLKKTGISLSEIKYIFLTHYHDDHAGLVAQIQKNIDVKLIIHENAIPYLTGVESKFVSKPFNWQVKTMFIIMRPFHKFGYPSVSIRETDIIIKEDDDIILRELGINGKIIYTPGHTDSDISILMDNGNAFIGDIAMSAWRFLGKGYYPIVIRDIKKIHESWINLANSGAKRLFPSHDRSFDINFLKK